MLKNANRLVLLAPIILLVFLAIKSEGEFIKFLFEKSSAPSSAEILKANNIKEILSNEEVEFFKQAFKEDCSNYASGPYCECGANALVNSRNGRDIFAIKFNLIDEGQYNNQWRPTEDQPAKVPYSEWRRQIIWEYSSVAALSRFEGLGNMPAIFEACGAPG